MADEYKLQEVKARIGEMARNGTTFESWQPEDIAISICNRPPFDDDEPEKILPTILFILAKQREARAKRKAKENDR